MVTSLRRREETASTNLAGSAARIERCEAASQSVRQPAVRPCVMQQQARAERYLVLQRVQI